MFAVMTKNMITPQSM